MQFSAYSEYKHSGVEWLGEVPEHWQIVRTKDIFQYRNESAWENDDIITCFRDGQVTLRKNRRTDGFTNALKEHGYQHICNGDLVIHEMDAFAGAIGVSDSDGKSTPVYTVLYPKNNNVNQYFYADFFRTMARAGFINSLAKGIRVRSTDFRWNESRNVYIAMPPIDEQNQIAQFLDKETAKIDELIAKQEQLIVLLEEQRKSVISYAVTKGLNPNAPMKDSGVEWLGEVPEHWDIRKVFSLCEQIGSGTTPSATNNDYYENGTINFLQTGDLTDGYVNLTKKKITEKALNEFSALKIYPKDSLVIAMYGATIGKIGILNIETTVNQACCVLNLSSQIDLNFAYYLFLSAKSFLISLSQGGTQPNINQDSIKSLRVTLPSKSEQRQIVEFLKKETLLIDNLIQKQQELITQLKEYRSSVISHAVTGKIDVRGLV